MVSGSGGTADLGRDIVDHGIRLDIDNTSRLYHGSMKGADRGSGKKSAPVTGKGDAGEEEEGETDGVGQPAWAWLDASEPLGGGPPAH